LEKYVIGLDSSTTGTKAILLNKRGDIIMQTHTDIPLSSPQPNYYEQNPEDWWRSASAVLSQISKEVKVDAIEAISIANQRETFVPLDINGNPLRPAIIWLDERCKNEVEQFAGKIGGDKIHKITGKPVDYAPVVYRLAWMKKHEPHLFKKIAMICDVHCYLNWKLTGSFKTSLASADPLGLIDMNRNKWSAEILSVLELTEEQLPEIAFPGTVLGVITNEAHRFTGLSAKTGIVAGGGDGQAAGLGVNVLSAGRAYLNLGTAVVAGIYGSKYEVKNAFRTMYACAENGYYYECSLRAGTFAIDWFIKNILKVNTAKQPGIYEQLEREAQQTEAGCAGLMFLPYLNGVMNPYWNPEARGAFTGLSSSHQRGHMYRAILEGIAFEQKLAIELVEQAAGLQVRELVTIGGGSQSELWCRILADITGKTICLPENKEASALGAGIAAAVGAGWYSSFKEAAKKMTGRERLLNPDTRNYQVYQNIFKTYRNMYHRLK
jgi:D-xylulose kinase